eukprot:TRINITY_DN15968_c0_g1_i1.p1 TRINITY_DN15968_c0_g1~~TRINITY_DN15968_c0_g1_i1.p1  ORF type:complete len:124 (+),score=14.96 TRINITY_DN15968_c0_g1_i1:186-557(+)
MMKCSIGVVLLVVTLFASLSQSIKYPITPSTQYPLPPPKGWIYSPYGDSLERNFTFSDFNEAFGFLTRVALVAAIQDHHPFIQNLYNFVQLSLSTDDVNPPGVTQLDINLATAINSIVANLTA